MFAANLEISFRLIRCVFPVDIGVDFILLDFGDIAKDCLINGQEHVMKLK